MAGDRQVDHYKILQVDPEAEAEVVQAAYRRLARKYHPDVASGAEAAERMATINRAWDVLRDEGRRAAYDVERRRTVGGRSEVPAEGAARREARPSTGERPLWHHSDDAAASRKTEGASPDWGSGRSTTGGRYDASMRAPDGHGAAGPPPGAPSGRVIDFGRYAGWSLGEIARVDPGFLEWLDRMPIGRSYRDEIDALLRRLGRRRTAPSGKPESRGLFRRR